MLQLLTLQTNYLDVQTGMCRPARVYPEHNRFNNWMHRAIFYMVCDIWVVISYIIVKSKCELMEVLKQPKEFKEWHHLMASERILNDGAGVISMEEWDKGVKQK